MLDPLRLANSYTMKGRLIAIGDIHGCHLEFSEMLDKLKLKSADRLVLLGDLVNRGPDSAKVIDLAIKTKAIAILGNHEIRLLKYRKSLDKSILRECDYPTLKQLKPRHWAYLKSMRLTYEVRKLNLIFVHAGFLPGMPWRKQSPEIVTRIQSINKNGEMIKRSKTKANLSWAAKWRGPRFVVYGHTPRSKIYKLKWSVGIDTSCVLGGFLTAYVLPKRTFVQVKAKERYYP